jgi:hypothetical protein
VNEPWVRPPGSTATRPPERVYVGGVTKSELLAELERRGVRLNEIARQIFAHPGFRTYETQSVQAIADVSVGELGLLHGAITEKILEVAGEAGLSPCALELAPHFRLQYIDQPEGHRGRPPSAHRAPPGSLTIATQPLAEAGGMALGFYLRRIDGILWLRGYRAPADHVWDPGDRFVFRRSGGTAASPMS